MNLTEKIIIRVEEGTEEALRLAAKNADREYTDFMRRVYARVIAEDKGHTRIEIKDGRD